jgi:PIN domain nuclease of toxin-antitoxin system
MTILLDTQVFIWLVNNDPRLGTNAVRILADTSNKLTISYFSFFEITIKASIGKLTYDSSIIDDLPEMEIELIMPDIDILRDYSILNPDNRDPFDNIIMSVARKEKCALITSDHKLLAVDAKYIALIDATI